MVLRCNTCGSEVEETDEEDMYTCENCGPVWEDEVNED
jgi:DNA-directed RNA polymerase subunit RPC12/RpoP